MIRHSSRTGAVSAASRRQPRTSQPRVWRPVDAVDERAEQTRLRYLYRDLVLKGKIRLPLDGARALIGPDCAYHLYGRLHVTPRRNDREAP